jgi:peptide-methionine (S)-S-oxide reductase
MNEEQNAFINEPRGTEVATLGGGCFWCVEAVFDELKGVERVESGYSGGANANPTYRQVCSGTTGHAEVVRVTFDPQVISFREILEVFLTTHDPTTLNRQGADVGTQYRSVIFYRDEEQKKVAEQVIEEFNAGNVWDAPIVTEVTPLKDFYKAEDYHQEYFKLNGEQPYCRAVIAPKVAKLRQHYQAKLKRA